MKDLEWNIFGNRKIEKCKQGKYRNRNGVCVNLRPEFKNLNCPPGTTISRTGVECVKSCGMNEYLDEYDICQKIDKYNKQVNNYTSTASNYALINLKKLYEALLAKYIELRVELIRSQSVEKSELPMMPPSPSMVLDEIERTDRIFNNKSLTSDSKKSYLNNVRKQKIKRDQARSQELDSILEDLELIGDQIQNIDSNVAVNQQEYENRLDEALDYILQMEN